MLLQGNRNLRVLESASRTATLSSSELENLNGKGVHVVLDMTTVGTGSVTLSIEGKDAISGKWYAILTGSTVTTNSTNVYKVYPGLTAAANSVASDIIPALFRITVTHNNANAAVYTVGASVVR